LFFIFNLGELPDKYQNLSGDRRETVSNLLETGHIAVIHERRKTQLRRETNMMNNVRPDDGKTTSLN
jgi:hypothetical protein